MVHKLISVHILYLNCAKNLNAFVHKKTPIKVLQLLSFLKLTVQKTSMVYKLVYMHDITGVFYE